MHGRAACLCQRSIARQCSKTPETLFVLLSRKRYECLNPRKTLLLLKSRETQSAYLVLCAAEQSASAGVEEGVRAWDRRGCFLGDLVAQVLDQDLIGALVQHRKSIARNKDRRGPAAPFGLLTSITFTVSIYELLRTWAP